MKPHQVLKLRLLSEHTGRTNVSEGTDATVHAKSEEFKIIS